jgi:hypothetical protein
MGWGESANGTRESEMRAFVHATMVVSAFLMAGVAKGDYGSDSENSPTPFEFDLCLTAATHIVLTTPEGVVLESWRGDLAPGDTVKLGSVPLAPIDTISMQFTRLRGEHPYGEWYLPGCLGLKSDRGREPAVLDRQPGRRLLLFLRKVHDDTYGDFWWPAANSHQTIERRGLYESLSLLEIVSSTSSTLLVEDGVVFGLAPGVTGHRYGTGYLQMAVVSRSLPALKILIESEYIKGIRNSDREDLIFESCDSYREKPTLDLKTCVARATDIVVVNGVGRVTEVWKGDTKPDEVIPDYHAVTCSQRVLFLVRQCKNPDGYSNSLAVRNTSKTIVEYDLLGNVLPDHSPQVIPQRGFGNRLSLWFFPTENLDTRSYFTQPTSSWLPANESGGFEFSMASIDQFGMVFTKQLTEVLFNRLFGYIGPMYEYRWLPLTSVESFRQQVFEMVESMRGGFVGIEAQSNNIVASGWDFR